MVILLVVALCGTATAAPMLIFVQDVQQGPQPMMVGNAGQPARIILAVFDLEEETVAAGFNGNATIEIDGQVNHPLITVDPNPVPVTGGFGIFTASADQEVSGTLTASLPGESQETVQQQVKRLNQRLHSLQTDVELRVANSEAATPLAGADEHWYTLSGVVGIKGEEASRLLELVAVLRGAGATDITITPLTYRFREEAFNVRTLRERLQRRG